MEQNSNPELRWEGKVYAKLSGPTADQAWSLLKEFCSLHKWVPSIDTCYKLEGNEGEPGCMRYCAGSVNRSAPAQEVGWSKERLVAFDPAGRSYTYEIVESNKGFGRYTATIRVVPDPEGVAEGCCIEWCFAADPVRGWTRAGFVAFLAKLAQGVAARVEEETIRLGE
ncbi:lachrymatory-factor synthase [Phoenix dactylifera]|uniref:Lachrymatory-factor synthase n=1 Tax=Phoenix dactylifera TaxID=42345 RepID=A0A8B7CR27_PHODC|nr:lachrymatory-factor synthase [Phoenix dactylifera]